MEAMNQMMDQVLRVAESTQYSQSKSSGAAKSGNDSDSFDSMVRQKQQQAKPQTKSQTDRKTAPEKDSSAPAEADKTQPGEEQVSMAAALMYQGQAMMELLVPAEEAGQAQILETFAVQVTEEAAGQTEQVIELAPETLETAAVAEEAAPELVTVQHTQAAQTAEATVQTREEETVQAENVVRETPVFGEVEAAPVKVSDPVAEPLPLEADDADRQLAARIELLPTDENGNSQVELTLEPASLGRITVNITHGADGTMHIQLAATTERAQSLLTHHSQGLQHLLTSQSRPSVEIDVRRSQEAAQYLNPNAGNQQQQQQRQRQSGQEGHAESFVQQLRLGLVDLDGRG
ncbi:MAG: flagellar hook-length control protein FliK [Oscillospiraceae bacterium]|nr:flagellar hook-length control protein FliK [Oscillospiraceae bacterium]